MAIKYYLLIILVLFVIVITNNSLFSQEKDFTLWSSIGIDKKINKKISFEGEVQLRLNRNAQNVNGWYYSADMKYKINKKWRAIIQTRYRTSEGNDALRIGGGINYDFKIKKIKIDIRQLYQLDMPMYKFSFDTENNIRHQLRTRLKLDFDLTSKLTTSIAAEPYLRFNEGNIYLARVRYAVGFDYEFIKNTTLQLQYLVQPNYNPTGFVRRMDYIFGVGLVRKI